MPAHSVLKSIPAPLDDRTVSKLLGGSDGVRETTPVVESGPAIRRERGARAGSPGADHLQRRVAPPPRKRQLGAGGVPLKNISQH